VQTAEGLRQVGGLKEQVLKAARRLRELQEPGSRGEALLAAALHKPRHNILSTSGNLS
jgi:hypothetical protein